MAAFEMQIRMGHNEGFGMRCESKKPHSLRENGAILADELSTSRGDPEGAAFVGVRGFTKHAMSYPSMVLHSLLSVG